LAIIALLNLRYWCKNEAEKKRLQTIYAQNEKEYQDMLYEKYNPNNIFKKDEMKLRGKSKEEADSLLEDFVQAFSQNIDFQKVGKIFGDTKEQVGQFFAILTASGNNYAYAMAEKIQKPGEQKNIMRKSYRGIRGLESFMMSLVKN